MLTALNDRTAVDVRLVVSAFEDAALPRRHARAKEEREKDGIGQPEGHELDVDRIRDGRRAVSRTRIRRTGTQ